MAKYTIQSPDGKTITLEGPEGASHEDVIAQAQKLYQPTVPKKEGFFSGVNEMANPFPAIGKVLSNPGGGQAGLEQMARDVIESHVDQIKKGLEAWGKGDHVEAIAHFGGAALPALGPAAATIGEHIGQEGFTSQNLGRVVGLIGSVAGPAVAKEVAPKVVKGAANAARETTKAAREAKAVIDVATDPANLRKVVELSATGKKAMALSDEMRAQVKAKTAPPSAQRPSVERVSPAWADIEASGPPVPPEFAPSSAAESLSGRKPGGIQNQVQPVPPQPPVARVPAWQQFPATADEPVPPSPQPPPAALPSGRVPGGIQNQVSGPRPPAPTDIITPELLNDIAKGQTGKSYQNLKPEQQAQIRQLAQAIQRPNPTDVIQNGKPVPVSEPAPASKAPPIQTKVPKGASADEIKKQLADEMLANGTATPEMLGEPKSAPDVTPAGKKALATAMRDMPPGAPRATADASYAGGNREPGMASAVYEAAGRANKAQSMSQMLHDEGLSAAKVAKWDEAKWLKAYQDRGFDAAHEPFSMESRGEVVKMLRKLERTIKK